MIATKPLLIIQGRSFFTSGEYRTVMYSVFGYILRGGFLHGICSPGLADDRQQSLARGTQVFRLCQFLELKKARTGFLSKGIDFCSLPYSPNWSKHEHRVGVEVLWLPGRAMFPGLD